MFPSDRASLLFRTFFLCLLCKFLRMVKYDRSSSSPLTATIKTAALCLSADKEREIYLSGIVWVTSHINILQNVFKIQSKFLTSVANCNRDLSQTGRNRCKASQTRWGGPWWLLANLKRNSDWIRGIEWDLLCIMHACILWLHPMNYSILLVTFTPPCKVGRSSELQNCFLRGFTGWLRETLDTKYP